MKNFKDGLISIHAPAKGATFLTRNIKYQTYISIHAPAKGATLQKTILILLQVISIHAPAKGATYYYTNQVLTVTHFNPRTREGCDLIPLVLQHRFHYISIHAPAKGATAHGCTVCD